MAERGKWRRNRVRKDVTTRICHLSFGRWSHETRLSRKFRSLQAFELTGASILRGVGSGAPFNCGPLSDSTPAATAQGPDPTANAIQMRADFDSKV
jgi:hypothetical protein